MARCGCTSTCSCLVVAGDNVTVTGVGSQANPYVISADVQGLTTVEDTPSIDMTLTGTGATGDPYVISSAVKLSADENNCAVFGTDGALFVPCPDGTETLVEGGNNIIVTGDGSEGNPYVVSANFSNSISTDPNNCISLGTDGGMFVPCGDTALTSGNGTTLAGAGTGGDPFHYDIDAGCGLEVVGDQVRVSTVTDPGIEPVHPITGAAFACNETNADWGSVWCDANGNLRTLPEHTSQTALTTDVFTVDSPIFPNNSPFTTAVITNSSDCRTLCGYLQVAHIATVTVGANGAIQINHSTDLNTGAFFVTTAIQQWNDGPNTRNMSNRSIAMFQVCIPPGGSATYRYRVNVTQIAANAANRFISTATEIRFFGSTV